jgi:CRP/FNR family transcriptional regulator, cyclic AMP receptor protein
MPLHDGCEVNKVPIELGSTEACAHDVMGGCGTPGFDPANIAGPAPDWQLVAFSEAQQIYAEGDPSDRLYIVISGTVKLSRTSSFGRTLTIVGPREMFGALSLFDPGPRILSATALGDVRAVAIEHDAIRSRIAKHPDAAQQFMQILARRLKRTNDEIADLVFLDGMGRVAKRLLQLARRMGTPEAGALRVAHHLTQVEIAQLAGVSRETVNHSISEFTRRGWITADRRQTVLIRNAERLARRAR